MKNNENEQNNTKYNTVKCSIVYYSRPIAKDSTIKKFVLLLFFFFFTEKLYATV